MDYLIFAIVVILLDIHFSFKRTQEMLRDQKEEEEKAKEEIIIRDALDTILNLNQIRRPGD